MLKEQQSETATPNDSGMQDLSHVPLHNIQDDINSSDSISNVDGKRSSKRSCATRTSTNPSACIKAEDNIAALSAC